MNRQHHFRDTLTMVSRSMKHTVRHIDILIMTLVMPLLQLLMLVFVFGGALRTGNIPYINYVLPGILLMTIGNSASMAAASVKEDMAKGIMDRFRAMAISRSAVLNGHMAATVARSSITAAVILAVSVLMGFRTQMGAADYLLAFAILFLFTLAYTWCSILWGLKCKSVEGAGAIAYLAMFLPYVSSCFVPIESMPKALQAVARYQPFTPLAESLRGLILGTPVERHAVTALLWCGVILLIAFFFSIRTYKRKANA